MKHICRVYCALYLYELHVTKEKEKIIIVPHIGMSNYIVHFAHFAL